MLGAIGASLAKLDSYETMIRVMKDVMKHPWDDAGRLAIPASTVPCRHAISAMFDRVSRPSAENDDVRSHLRSRSSSVEGPRARRRKETMGDLGKLVELD